MAKKSKVIKAAKAKLVSKTETKTKTKIKPEVATKKRNYVLLSKAGEEIGRYTGSAPRQAALKAANAGVVDIFLRETGVKRVRSTRDFGRISEIKIHTYRGSKSLKPKKPTDPAWLPDMISIPKVEKICTEWVRKDA